MKQFWIYLFAITTLALTNTKLSAQSFSTEKLNYNFGELVDIQYSNIPSGSTIILYKDNASQPMLDSLDVKNKNGVFAMKSALEPGLYTVKSIKNNQENAKSYSFRINYNFDHDSKNIFLMTDIHVMSPDLIKKDGSAWQSYLENDRKLEDYSYELYQAAIDSILKRKPEVVLIPGDLTKDGERLSHEVVVKGLKKLREAGIQSFVIPGNHDINNTNAVYYNGNNKEKAATISEEEFKTLYADHGYARNIEQDASSLSYIVEIAKGVKLLAIDSKSGSLSTSTLQWVTDRAKEARHEGYKVIAMMHHPIMEHFSDEMLLSSTSAVSDADNIRKQLMEAGIKVVFTGHFHTTDIAKDPGEQKGKELYDVTTGSLITYPSHYRWITINSNNTVMNIHTGLINEVKSTSNFLTMARNRLAKAVLKQLENRGLTSLYSPLCKAFLTHAEGNENLKRTNDILDEAYWISIIYPNLMPSLLGDINFYGEEKQDIANDLELTIGTSSDIGKNTNGIHNIEKNQGSGNALYNLAGQKVGKNYKGIVASPSPSKKGGFILINKR